MPNNEAKIRRISRLLTPENRVNLLTWVRLAYFAENSAKKYRKASKTNQKRRILT